MAQQVAEVGEIEEGTTVELRYERWGQIPSHHDRVRERTVEVMRNDSRFSTILRNGKTEYRIYNDGEVFVKEIDGNFRRAVKTGDLLEVTPT